VSLSIVSNGSPVAIGGVKLVAASATDLENCKFWNDRGSRKASQSDETAVTLEVGTTAKTVAELYFEATGENFHDRFGLEAIGMTADAPANEIDVYLSGNTDSVDYSAPTTKIFVCGQVPQEVWSYGAGVADGSAYSGAFKAQRKDSLGSIAAADGDLANIQMDSDGWVRAVVKGLAGPGASAEQFGGFPVVGMCRTSDRGAIGPTEGAVLTMSSLAKLISLPYAIPQLTWSSVTTFTSGGGHASTLAKAAGGSGVRHYVTSIMLADKGGAAPAGLHVEVKDGTTVIAVLTPGDKVSLPTPLRFSANTDINLDPSAAHDMAITLVGYSAGE